MQRILILGATSKIAEETARRYARRGARLCLVGRSAPKLAALQADLQVCGAAQVDTLVQELGDTARHSALVEQALTRLGHLDAVLVAYGTLPDQRACEQDPELALQEIHTNFLSIVSLLTLLANVCEAQGHGCLAVISSVAGDRGRQSNYVYGSAKGGLTVFLAGLRNRLHKSGARVLTVKPGFVDTPMTAHLPKNFMYVAPEKIARDIERAIDRGQAVLYTPWFWRWIMLIIRAIPERLFVNLKL